jgi:predicted DNA-binding transcriptional regulator YafY
MSEIDRLYSYRTLLSGRRVVPRSEILSKLEISPATFKRDLAKLRDRLNIPIEFDRELSGYKLANDDARTELPGLWFSQEEVLALLTIHNMIDQLEPGILGPKLKPLQLRLNNMMSSQGLNAQTLARRVKLLHAGKRRLKLKCFELIAKATLERKKIRVEHFNRQNGETLSRLISPQQLVHYRDNWYLDAWCHLREGLRNFAIDAIHECEILEEIAFEVEIQKIKDEVESGYGIFGGRATEWATLKFSPNKARWISREEWHPEQRSRQEQDGSFILEIPYSDTRELIADILRHGAEVEVISPSSLRHEILTVIEKMKNRYENYS